MKHASLSRKRELDLKTNSQQKEILFKKLKINYLPSGDPP